MFDIPVLGSIPKITICLRALKRQGGPSSLMRLLKRSHKD